MLKKSLSQCSTMIENAKPGIHEFEVSYLKVSNKKFIKLLLHLKKYIDTEKEISLDIIYNIEKDSSYRCTIYNLAKINKLLAATYQQPNTKIFCSALSDLSNTLMHKKKEQFLVLNEFNMKIRLSSEEIMKIIPPEFQNIPIVESSKILYRFKQRIKCNMPNDYGRIDITIVTTADTPNKLKTENPTYEVEYELQKFDKDKINEIIDQIVFVKSLLDGSSEPMSVTEINNIITTYQNLLNHNDKDRLYSMQPISAEVEHVINEIPNKYATCDKTDGEKYQLVVLNDDVFLISNNMEVRKTMYVCKNINNTILEGEIINIDKVEVFLAYDCLFYNGIDMRSEKEFKKRYDHIFKILSKIYNTKMDKSKSLIDHYKLLNNQLKINEDKLLLFWKHMIFPSGLESTEVFKNAIDIWDICTSSDICPYPIDGMIWTPIEQIYTKHKHEQKNTIYKYKPPNMNSIDVYIVFKKNLKTGKYIEFFDGTLPGSMNESYRIANFYVGDRLGDKEVPVPFMKDKENDEAYFQVSSDGNIYDIENKPVRNNTVVEIIYINNQEISHKYRWKILRTRYDKTNYGNFSTTAIKIWKSILESLTIDELRNLSKPESFESQVKILKSKDNKDIKDIKDTSYYQKISELGKDFRAFSNFIKSQLIYTYGENSQSVLDIGCGRGGDIEKWMRVNVKKYVGIDLSYEDLYGSIDSATSRLKNISKKYPNSGNYTFIQADARLLLTPDIQKRSLNNITETNKLALQKVFGKTPILYDVISIQFSIHYLFDTQESVDNLVNIIKLYLKPGGYIICTLLDSREVVRIIGGNTEYATYYIQDGIRKEYFKISRTTQGVVKDTYGQGIDVYMSWVADEYRTEYLVSRNLLVNTFELADCILIETNLFKKMYHMYENWILQISENTETDFMNKLKDFYTKKDSLNMLGKEWTNLFRYYVFQKKY
jgi:SAM-dependent methyltransferase